VSRLVGEVVTPGVRAAGNEVRRLMAAYREKADLIAIGAYQAGTDPLTDAAIAARDPIGGFLRQSVETPSSAEEADAALTQLALLSGASPAVPVAPAEPAATGGETPLHAAIPPLHLAA
jgi:flagellum-specific ATP synthase